jgi:hypothetical protein
MLNKNNISDVVYVVFELLLWHNRQVSVSTLFLCERLPRAQFRRFDFSGR